MHKYIVIFVSLLASPVLSSVAPKTQAGVLNHFQVADQINKGAKLDKLRPMLTAQNVDPQLTGADEYITFETPLLAAIRQGDVELVTALVDLGASVVVPLDKNDTALHFCLREKNKNYAAIAKILIENGASITHENEAKETPEAIAAKDTNQVVRNLLGIKKAVAIAGRKSKVMGPAPKKSAVVQASASNQYSLSWFASRGALILFSALVVNKVYADLFGNVDSKDEDDEE